MPASKPSPAQTGSAPPGAPPVGFAPVTHVRVRLGSGIPSCDPAGNVRINSAGQLIWAQPGELLDCSGWRHTELLLGTRVVLPISPADYEAAPQCAHGARFAVDAFPGEACKCEVVLRDTGKPWPAPDVA